LADHPAGPASDGHQRRRRLGQAGWLDLDQLPPGLEPPDPHAPEPPRPRGLRLYPNQHAEPVELELRYAGTLPDPGRPGARRHLWLAISGAHLEVDPDARMECDELPAGATIALLFIDRRPR
jgi:hypothetical protein